MATGGVLTAINKKLVDDAARTKGTPVAIPAKGGKSKKTPHPRNYCWTHKHCSSKEHMSASCAHKATGHCDNVTASNTCGGSEKDKGWDLACTCWGGW
jgi:hypothetical protein